MFLPLPVVAVAVWTPPHLKPVAVAVLAALLSVQPFLSAPELSLLLLVLAVLARQHNQSEVPTVQIPPSTPLRLWQLAAAAGVLILPVTSTGPLVGLAVVALGPETEPAEQVRRDKALPAELVIPMKVAVVVEVPALLGRTLLQPTRVVPEELGQQLIPLGVSLLTLVNSSEALGILLVVVVPPVSSSQAREGSVAALVLTPREQQGRLQMVLVVAVGVQTIPALPVMAATGF
jgi:hypothetical protein